MSHAPSPAATLDRRRDAAVAAGCALAALAIYLLFRGVRVDDAFITFRYARNLVEGGGFTFNPGQRVLGTTSPLFTVVCAGLYALSGPRLPEAAIAVNAAALGAQGWLLYALLRDRLPWTGVATAGLVVAGIGSPYLWLPLETHLAAALALGCLLALTCDRPVFSGLLAGLAFLARPDGFLLVPVVLFAYRRRPRPALVFLVTAGLTVLPWLLFASLYFGSPLPTTLGAKHGITGLGFYVAYHLSQTVTLPGLTRGNVWLIAGTLLLVAGALVTVREVPRLRPFLTYSAALFAAYALLGPPAAQHWHVYLPMLAGRLLMLLGPLVLLERRMARRTGLRRTLLAVVSSIALLALATESFRQSRDVAGDFWVGLRDERYRIVASWIGRHVGPQRTFMAAEIGTLGYLTDEIMIDPYGLVSPTNDLPRSHALEDHLDLIRAYRPDLLLIDSPVTEAILERISPYRTVRVFDWPAPAPILMLREPSVLRRPTEAGELRRAVLDRRRASTAPDEPPV